MAGQADEVGKLQLHLSLLREQYVRVQRELATISRQHAVLAAAQGQAAGASGYVGSLVATVNALYNSERFSDIVVKVGERRLHAHRVVLQARGCQWPLNNLTDATCLDWSEMSFAVASEVLYWIYTDQTRLSCGIKRPATNETNAGDNNPVANNAGGDDDFVLAVMTAANTLQLNELRAKCEDVLMSWVTVRNCIKFYSTAEKVGASALKNYCSQLVSTHWNDFTSEDFADMKASLVYDMIRAKTKFPLHSAIRLRREDVVFLYLIEFSDQLSECIDAVDESGAVALDMSLRLQLAAISETLVKHGASVDGPPDADGRTLLHRAIRRGDEQAAVFLLEHGACVNSAIASSGDTALHLLAYCDDVIGASDDVSGAGAQEWRGRVATLLLDAGANVSAQNAQLRTPLQSAVVARCPGVFDVLLSHVSGGGGGGVLELRDCDGHTALWHALLPATTTNNNNNNNKSKSEHNSDSADIVWCDKLVRAGASVDAVNPRSRNSLLHMTALHALQRQAGFLVAHCANTDLLNAQGETVLHIAAGRGLCQLVSLLLDAGAAVNTTTAAGRIVDGVGGARTEVGGAKAPVGGVMHEFSDVHSQTALHLAVCNGHGDVVSAILQHSERSKLSTEAGASAVGVVDLSITDSRDKTVLAVALDMAATEIAEQLVASGASVEAPDSRGLSPLQRALIAAGADNDTEAAASAALFLIKHGANINTRTPDGRSCLQLAIASRREDVVERLCRLGVDMSTAACYEPPLWLALMAATECSADEPLNDTQNAGFKMAAVLVKYGADVDCWQHGPDECRQTLLHRAIDENNSAAACFLIRNGCDVVSGRRVAASDGVMVDDAATPLHLCAQWGLLDVADTLLLHGAPVNRTDGEQKTPLHVAVENQYETMTARLLAAPDVDVTSRDRLGRSPFTLAVSRRNNTAAQAILDRQPGVAEQYDSRGRNFLHVAVEKGDMESVMFLLSIHVNVHTRTRNALGLTPLHLASETDCEIILRNLICAGASVGDTTPDGRTPLHLAAAADRHQCVSALLASGAPYNAVDQRLDNALHLACRAGHVSCVRVLLSESSIDAEAVNAGGRTPLHCVVASNTVAVDTSVAICRLFLETMPDYPLNTRDADGNTPLLLAYMRGSVSVCMMLVRGGSALGATANVDGVSMFNFQVATKQLLYRLLDSLETEPVWCDADLCMECNTKFSIATRKHHCRHCGRVLCSKCSDRQLAIVKYGINKPARVCAVCYQVLTLGTPQQ